MKRESVESTQSASSRTLNKWLGGAAIGAIAMYLSDPDRGKRRRALARDKLQSLMSRASSAIDVTSRDLGNRVQGLRMQASRALMRRGTVSDDQLITERVRARIGRAVSHPHAIRVTADNGCVTLTGPILTGEKEQLLAAVRAVPGVESIDDALEVHDRQDVSSLQGEGRRRQLRPLVLHENWPPALRAIATLGGGALSLYALRRRSAGSMLLATVGLGLIARGMTNMPLKRAAGMDTSRAPVHLQKTIYIEAPPETVFNHWSNFENFPQFMSTVREVRDLGNGRSHWVVNGIAGAVVEWDAILTESRMPEVLAWKSEPNATVCNEGMVRFEPVNSGTRVTVTMDYRPPAGVLGHAVAQLFNGDPKKQMDEDLMRMKSFIESGITPHDAARHASHEARILH